jgi:hypothetical protein
MMGCVHGLLLAFVMVENPERVLLDALATLLADVGIGSVHTERALLELGALQLSAARHRACFEEADDTAHRVRVAEAWARLAPQCPLAVEFDDWRTKHRKNDPDAYIDLRALLERVNDDFGEIGLDVVCGYVCDEAQVRARRAA